MMLLQMHILARERHERMQREAELASVLRLAIGRPEQTNRPNRLRLTGRR